MQALIIQATNKKARPGDLAAQVEDQELRLPRAVALAMEREGIRTAADLLSYMQAFPSAVASLLHWQQRDVMEALARLKAQLAGRVPDEVLEPGRFPEPIPGALDPDLLPDCMYK